MTSAIENQFDLIQADVFDKLRNADWFIAAISLEYRKVAKSFDCFPVMSAESLLQVHDIFWDEADRGKAKNLPPETKSLDQFKLSAYLCFWLRRMKPIREHRPLGTLSERSDWQASDDRLPIHVEQFILYGNEIAALTIAIKLSQYLSQVIYERTDDTNIRAMPYRVKMIDRPTIIEYAKILKHKNISAHGLYMALHMLSGVGQRIVEIDRVPTGD